MIELGGDGDVASLVSHYKYGRTVRTGGSFKPRFTTVDRAKAVFSATLPGEGVKAGLLPMQDGTYVPVYEVTTVTVDAQGTPNPRTEYFRADTLERVHASQTTPAAGYEVEEEMDPQTRVR
jgi:hypothetical protein